MLAFGRRDRAGIDFDFGLERDAVAELSDIADGAGSWRFRGQLGFEFFQFLGGFFFDLGAAFFQFRFHLGSQFGFECRGVDAVVDGRDGVDLFAILGGQAECGDQRARGEGGGAEADSLEP